MNKCGSKVVLALLVVLLATESCLCANTDQHPHWQYLPTRECGVGAMAERIIGGTEASLGQFPWMAHLAYQLKPHNQKLYFICAGSIINRWYVVSANHCFLGSLEHNIRQVRVGENFLQENVDCDYMVCAPPIQDIDVAGVIKFKHYGKDSSGTYGDIALVKLFAPMQFNDFVTPICLPRGIISDRIDDYMSPGKSVEVAGWGTTNTRPRRIPNKLMHVQMLVIPLDRCKKNFPKNKIDESMICVGIGKGKDSCMGDSGGPLMRPIVLGASTRHFLFGIVSYGTKTCGMVGSVYTNVTYYLKWILDNIEPLE